MQIAASVMGVLAVGGVVVALSGGAGSPLAPVEVAKVTTSSQTAPAHRAPGNARYDFLVAHQSLAGGPMPSAVQYVRTVSTTAEE
jgi:sigma-E factor negative regulatory protein RseA